MLDEPSLGLAPLVIDQIYDAIAKLSAEGLAILIVEESLERISAAAGSLSLLNHGEMVWSGKPDDLMQSETLVSTYMGL